MTKEFFNNLVCTLYSKGALLSKATGGKFSASKELVTILKESSDVVSVEEILSNMGENDLQGVSIQDGEAVFDGFPQTDDEVEIRAQQMLEKFVKERCAKPARILAKPANDENEKFAFRIWLISLGIKGDEYKSERKVLYKRLSGSVAFRTEASHQTWLENQQKRKRA